MNPQTSGTYHMNNIPRGTSREALVRSLTQHWRVHDAPLIYGLVLQTLLREPIIHDSKLDDGLSVTTLQFNDTPKWFKDLDRDPDGFPKKSRLGTLWRGVDMTSLDADRRNEFTTAVIAGDLLYAETLAEFEETNVNSQDNAGRTALHWACAANNIEMASFCLSVPGMDTSLRDSDGLTAFDISCNHEDEQEIIPRLFYQGMLEMEKKYPDDALLRLLTMSSEPDLDGPVFPAKALLRPVIRNNLPLVAALMETGVHLTAVNEAQETALHLAAKEGHEEMMEFLLDNSSRGESFDVDAVTEERLTPLHYAAANGHVEVLQTLLGHGADNAVLDIVGRTALDLAVENTHTAIKAILDTKGKEYENVGKEVDLAEQHGLPDLPIVLQQIVFQQPNEHIGTSGSTAFTDIYTAAANGDKEIVNKLLDQGADIEGMDSAGSTALLCAVSSVQFEMVLMLLNRGADINARDLQQLTALHLAGSVGTVEVVGLLLDRGANIDAKESSGWTPLQYAQACSNNEVVQLLKKNMTVVGRSKV